MGGGECRGLQVTNAGYRGLHIGACQWALSVYWGEEVDRGGRGSAEVWLQGCASVKKNSTHL